MHLLVTELYYVVVDVDAVRGEGESYVLARVLLYGAAVFDELLHDIPVHKRFAAEEVDVEVLVVTRVLYEKVDGAFARLETHEASFAVELALSSEAVGTVQVTGVSHVETECL